MTVTTDLRAEWEALQAQVERDYPIRIFTAHLEHEGHAEGDVVRVMGRYIPGAEDAAWMNMREIQLTYSPLLATPVSTLRGIVNEAINVLRYMHLHQEIDQLYTLLFGAQYEVELDLVHHIASDRIKAQAKLCAVEQIMIQEMSDGDRLQNFAGDQIVLED